MPTSDKSPPVNHPGKLGNEKNSPKEIPSGAQTLQDQEMPWWPELPDLDRLNIMAAPIEDRARILAAKISGTVEETMLAIAERTKLSYLQAFTIADLPTKLIPLRLIHTFSCLPINNPVLAGVKKTKVFVFDDEVSLHQDMKEYLGGAYEAVFVNDLQEALEVLGFSG